MVPPGGGWRANHGAQSVAGLLRPLDREAPGSVQVTHNRGAALTRGTFRPRPVMRERSRETGDIRADCAVYALRRYLPEPKQPRAASDSTTRRPLLSVMSASAHKHPPLTPSPNATPANPENSASSHPPYDLITLSPYHPITLSPRHTVSARLAILSIRAATPTSTG